MPILATAHSGTIFGISIRALCIVTNKYGTIRSIRVYYNNAASFATRGDEIHY